MSKATRTGTWSSAMLIMPYMDYRTRSIVQNTLKFQRTVLAYWNVVICGKCAQNGLCIIFKVLSFHDKEGMECRLTYTSLAVVN